jgi:hypothetical protein
MSSRDRRAIHVDRTYLRAAVPRATYGRDYSAAIASIQCLKTVSMRFQDSFDLPQGLQCSRALSLIAALRQKADERLIQDFEIEIYGTTDAIDRLSGLPFAVKATGKYSLLRRLLLWLFVTGSLGCRVNPYFLTASGR